MATKTGISLPTPSPDASDVSLADLSKQRRAFRDSYVEELETSEFDLSKALSASNLAEIIGYLEALMTRKNDVLDAIAVAALSDGQSTQDVAARKLQALISGTAIGQLN